MPTPGAFGDCTPLVQDALLVRGDELNTSAELIAFAILAAHGAGIADVGEDVGSTTLAADGNWLRCEYGVETMGGAGHAATYLCWPGREPGWPWWR